MEKFFYWLGAMILLLVLGSFVYRVIYALRTGHDLAADRMTAAAPIMATTKSVTVGSTDPLANL